jgi:hypothetical protein
MAQANGTPTNGTASTSGTADLITRGLALARALSTAPDAPVNAPLVDVDMVDEAPALDHDPEAAEVLGAMDAREHLDLSQRLTLD